MIGSVSRRTCLVVVAVGAVSAVGVVLVRRYDPRRVDPCADHRLVHRPDGTAPTRWLTDEMRQDHMHRSLVELFAGEPRDLGWAPGMEAQLRAVITPLLPRLPGATLSRVCCHSTACRIVVDLTPALKDRLNADARRALARAGRVGSPELTFGLATAALESMGFAVPMRRTNSARPWWSSLACRFGYCEVGGVAELRAFTALLREESTVLFDPLTYRPADYAAWLQRRKLARSAVNGEPAQGGPAGPP
jgi:hypothetical protein